MKTLTKRQEEVLEELTIANIREIRDAAQKAKTIGEWKRILRKMRDKFELTDQETIDIARGDLP